MKSYRIGFALVMLSFLTPTFANQCPSATQIKSCPQCAFQRLSGWSESIYYTDQKELFLQKAVMHGSQLNCYYAYNSPENHGVRPPAVVLRSLE